MTAEFKADGLADLLDQLSTFPDKIERNALRGAMRAGARVISIEAKARAPEKTSALKKSIRVSSNVKGSIFTATVKAGNKVAYWAQWVEFGTAAHLIKARKLGALLIGGSMAKSARHPGAAAHPFFRPAIALKSEAATQAVIDYLRKRLDKLNEPENEG